MKRNHYCCRCHKTTVWAPTFRDDDGRTVLTCTCCGASASEPTDKGSSSNPLCLLSETRLFSRH